MGIDNKYGRVTVGSPQEHLDGITAAYADIEIAKVSRDWKPPMEDSTLATLQHSRRVDELLLQLTASIQDRITKHDLSKMEDPEKAIFDEYSPKLKNSTYGSDEYKGYLAEMKVALDHHYAQNRHHPEHFENGVDGMTLVDLVEMLADWKAATERHADGDLRRSLDIQKERFGLSDQLVSVLFNTAYEAGWLA